MNYKNMLLIALLLPAFCYSQTKEDRIKQVLATLNQESDGEYSLQEGGGLDEVGIVVIIEKDAGEKFGIEAAKEFRALGNIALKIVKIGGGLIGLYIVERILLIAYGSWDT